MDQAAQRQPAKLATSSSTPVAVLMGKAGVGKTTLYNKLCETEHTATYSRKSLTRQLYRSEVAHGGHRFTVIDTPGTDSADEVFKHSFLLKEALTCQPVNAIFTLVHYNDRSDGALEEFDKTTAYLKPAYRSLVVVIVTKFDLAPAQHVAEIKTDYTAQFKAEGYGRILFHSSAVDAVTVAAEMLGTMGSMPQKQLRYKEAEFLQYFRVAEESRAQKKLVSTLEGEVRRTLQGYGAMLRELDAVEDKDDLIMSAIASSRYDVEQFYERFIEEHGAGMVELDCYTNSIALQKVITTAHREFRESAKEFMSYDPDDPKDWRNAVRRCQHCGEVWVKVSGCEGKTTCGSRPVGEPDITHRRIFRYLFRLDAQGRCTWTRNVASSERAQPLADQESHVWRGGSGRGCGKTIRWSDQPRLSKDELEKCLEVKGLDTLISSMQKAPEFRSAFDKHVRTIDTSFTK